MKKILIIILLSFSASVFAQTGGLSFLRQNYSVRNAGMGNIQMGEAKDMFLYSNPTSFLKSDNNIYGSYGFGSLSSFNQNFHTMSVGYKLKKQAFFIGARYFNGVDIEAYSNEGEAYQINTYDFSIDVGYARDLGHNLSAYFVGSFVKSYIGESGSTVIGRAGVCYDNTVTFASKNISYNVGVVVNNIGQKLKYGNGVGETKMPTSLGIGGTASTEIVKNHDISIAWNAFYYNDSKGITNSFGLEYELYNIVALRVGQYLERGDVRTTMGLGVSYKRIKFNAGYHLGNINMFSLGLTFH